MKIKGINFKYGALFWLCLMSFIVCGAPVQAKNDFKLKLNS